MNNTQKGVLALVKSGLTGKASDLPKDFSLDAAEQLIYSHHLVGMVYEGAIKCGISKQEPVMQRLFQKYLHYVIQDQKQMAALEQLFDVFETNGIPYLPVKGAELKSLYPNSAMRIMSDADVLIHMEQYEQISDLMRQLGYMEMEVSDHALVWDRDIMHLELHRRLIPTTSKDYYSYFGEGWQFAKHVEGNRYTLQNEVDFIFLLTHYAKHYREAGIGLRQTIDLWVYLQKVPLNQELLLQELAKLDMVAFYQNICNVLACWFEDRPMDEKTEYISDYLFDNGCWGSRRNWIISQGLRSSKRQGSVGKARAKMVLEAIFPPVHNMQKRYAILNKYPWLTPVVWPVRWVEAALFRRENIHKYAYNLEITSREEIDSFEQSLQYVGLKMDA